MLVCDVGGGTTDFSLISVESRSGELVLRRLAVGDHLLVGGDNMDLALAHHAQGLFAERGVTVDAWQSVALWHSCRLAKERLRSDEGPPSESVTVLDRGSRLVVGTISVDLESESVLSSLLDGFSRAVRSATGRPVGGAPASWRSACPSRPTPRPVTWRAS